MALSNEDVERVAVGAAKQAVRELLIAMGVNAHDEDALIEMQKDFAHVRMWRESVETVQKRSLIVATGFIVSGIIAAIWMALKGHIN